MAKKPVNDPLESAKVGKDSAKKSGWGKRSTKADPAEDAAVETSASVAVAPVAAPLPAPPKPVAPVGPKPTPPGVQKFKVLKTQRISRNGQVTSLKKDAIVSSQHYGGMPGIQKLKDNGVELEKIED